jgi:hypothetical protein
MFASGRWSIDVYHEGAKTHEDHEHCFVQERFVFVVALRAFVKTVVLTRRRSP